MMIIIDAIVETVLELGSNYTKTWALAPLQSGWKDSILADWGATSAAVEVNDHIVGPLQHQQQRIDDQQIARAALVRQDNTTQTLMRKSHIAFELVSGQLVLTCSAGAA